MVSHAEISTNAVLLTPEVSQAILDAGLGAIYLCLDGTTPETYEQVRREATFEQTREHILKFLELRNRGGYEQAAHQATDHRDRAHGGPGARVQAHLERPGRGPDQRQAFRFLGRPDYRCQRAACRRQAAATASLPLP